MASFLKFGQLELADRESGEAAVSVVAGKAEADAAESATGAEKEKAALKNNGITSIEIEIKRLREVLIKLRGDEKKLKDIGQDGRHLIQLSEEQRELRLKQLSEEQRELRQQQRKLREEQAKLRQQQQYVVKVTSDEHKPAEDASTKANADANPGSGSEKSCAAGAAASNNGHNGSAFQKNKLSGSQKRKKRNAAKKNGGNEVDKAKKQDSSEAHVSKKTDKEPMAGLQTLAEYEKIRQEKEKSSEDVSRTTERKVSAEEFKGLQMLEKKKLDDEEAAMKAEKAQKKAKDDDAKLKKAVKLPLKDLSFASPQRVVIYENASFNRGRCNGGYQSRNDSTDSRVPAAGRGGDNGRAAGNYGNGALRGGYSSGRGNPRGDYSGGRGDDGYHNQGSNGGGYERRQGNDNYYRPRGRGYSGNGPPAPNPKDMNLFPQLPASAPDSSRE